MAAYLFCNNEHSVYENQIWQNSFVIFKVSKSYLRNLKRSIFSLPAFIASNNCSGSKECASPQFCESLFVIYERKTFVLKQQSTHKECFHLCSLLTKKAIKSMKRSWKMNESWRKVNEKCLKSQQKCEKSHQKWISKWNSRKVKKWPVRKKATLLKVVHQNRSNDPTKSPKTRHLCGRN